MKKLLAIAAIVGALFTAPAMAGNNHYFGIDYSKYDLKISAYNFSDEIDTVSIRYGYMYNNYVGAEIRYGQGDGDIVDIDNYVSLLLKFQQPITPYNNVYLLGGYSKVEFSYGAYSDDEHDWSYGVGIDHKFSNSASVYLEYATLLDKNGGELAGPTLGVRWNF